MSIVRWLCAVSLGPCSLALLSGPAAAALNEVWVSRNGVDVASCGAVLSPCRTLQYAHNAIVTPNGTIYIREPGSFGPVIITKPIGIIGSDSFPASIQLSAPGSTAITINAGAGDKVFLKGLSLDGLDTASVGLSVLSGSVEIDDVIIRGFRDVGLLLRPTAAGTTWLRLSATKILDTGEFYANSFVPYPSGCGLHVEATAGQMVRMTMTDTDLDRNLTGLCIQANGGKVWATLDDDSLQANAREGLWESNFGSFAEVQVAINDTTLSDNGSGGLGTGAGAVFNGPTLVRIANSVITGNLIGVHVNINATAHSFGTNVIAGNGVDIVGTLGQTAPD